jgi:glycosyltransferase involved in cell wall biosynthesis
MEGQLARKMMSIRSRPMLPWPPMEHASSSSGEGRRKVLFVGAFPPSNRQIAGGHISDCRALLASSFPDRVDLILLDSTQVYVPTPTLARRAWRAARRIARFLWLLETRRPDAILIFASSGFGFVEKAMLAACGRLRHVPSLLSIRSGHFLDQCRRSSLFRGVARLLLRAPNQLLCQTEAWVQFLTKELYVSPERCTIIENWVASRELLAIGATRSSNQRMPLHIIFLGAIERFKGVFELVDAVALLRQNPTLPPFKVSIIGDGVQVEPLRAVIAAQRLGEIVRLEGLLEGISKLDALERADVFVLPSHTEGLPNAMIEAMAAALPVVVTPVGGIPDVIVDGHNGVIVPSHDASRLASALQTLLLSAALRRLLGQRAHDTVRTRFETERAARALASLIINATTPQPTPIADFHDTPSASRVGKT